MSHSAVAQCLRDHRRDITEAWRLAVANERPGLAGAEADGEGPPHLPDFLRRLADSAEDDDGRSRPEFLDAARRHALERLSAGITLEDLSLEYALLRKVLLEQLQALEPGASSLEALVRLNEALDRATELAVRCCDEQRSSQGERFVRMLGHDLRNPLNAASIATDALARSESLSDRGQKRLSTIARANARMGRLIENMLDFARSYFGGKLPLLLEEGDWGEVCEAAFEAVRVENPTRELQLVKSGNLEGAFDRERLRQAVCNMLGNALEHGKDPIELVITEEETDEYHAIVTRVTSRGDTSPPVSIQSLNPLAESKPAGSSSERIGLYVTSLIAQAHGAVCEMTSDAERTSFSVRWPRTRSA